MNLILSDVEETIMLVDGVEGAPPGQGVVNVSSTSPPNTAIFVLTLRPRWQKERWKCSLSEEMALFWYIYLSPSCCLSQHSLQSRYHPLHVHELGLTGHFFCGCPVPRAFQPLRCEM